MGKAHKLRQFVAEGHRVQQQLQADLSAAEHRLMEEQKQHEERWGEKWLTLPKQLDAEIAKMRASMVEPGRRHTSTRTAAPKYSGGVSKEGVQRGRQPRSTAAG